MEHIAIKALLTVRHFMTAPAGTNDLNPEIRAGLCNHLRGQGDIAILLDPQLGIESPRKIILSFFFSGGPERDFFLEGALSQEPLHPPRQEF